MKPLYFVALMLFGVTATQLAWSQQTGKDVYAKTCAVCHATGLAGAPRYGNAADWVPLAARGVSQMYQGALKGTPKGMPAKGGNLALPDAEVKAAVDYMLASVKDSVKPAAAKEDKPATKAAPKTVAKAAPQQELKTVTPPPAATAPVVAVQNAAPQDANAFNRLLKPASQRNLPPAEDGIHDPGNDGTHALLPPLSSFAALPKSFAGNRVNWVEALEKKKINPRWDKTDVNATPIIMDLNIVREVKGSMPDVVYPHKQHTTWLDCSNCHPAIFVPQKGANAISMAAILLGEKCGVCHGKVAFPVSECRLCHSKKKEVARAAGQ